MVIMYTCIQQVIQTEEGKMGEGEGREGLDVGGGLTQEFSD